MLLVTATLLLRGWIFMTTSFTNKKKQQTDDLSQLMPQNIDAEEALSLIHI